MFIELDDRLIQATQALGYKEPTAIQTETFEAAVDGEDLFVSAETGSGKTAAYLLPALERLLEKEHRQLNTLILVPTRELAQQVLQQAHTLAKFTELTLGLISGGTDIKKQIALLKDLPQLLVATPGRLMEVLLREEIELDTIETLILDEADRLLDIGFGDEILAIADHCAGRHQTQFYSATLTNKKLRGLADKLLDEPKVIALNQITDSHDNITQEIIFADDKAHKLQLLIWLLTNQPNRQAVIFTNSKEQADKLYGHLQHAELNAGILHGDRDQRLRDSVMNKLRKGFINILIATDVAARGIDVDTLDLVINFDMPRRGELYLHRIGRTGRAGQSGTAISLVMAPEYNLMAGIERFLKQTFKRRKIKELVGNYTGPKKLKSSGKAAGSKKKKLNKLAAKGKTVGQKRVQKAKKAKKAKKK